MAKTSKSLKRTIPDSIDPKSPSAIWKFIRKHLTSRSLDPSDLLPENYDPEIKPVPCTDFSVLIECMREKLYVHDSMEHTLAVMLAAHIGTSLGSVPLWFYIVGPASSGKTTLSDLVSAASPYVKSVSKITGIHSGFRSGVGKADASLFSSWQNMTVLIKDFTTVLAMTPDTRDRIFSELRDAYDGSSSAQYRNRVAHEYHGIKFTVLACVTEAIRKFNVSNLGERFLHCQIDTKWNSDQSLHTFSTSDDTLVRAMRSALTALIDDKGTSNSHLVPQKCMSYGFIEYLLQSIEQNPEHVARITRGISNKWFPLLAAMGKIISASRAYVDGTSHRPKPEAATRVAIQLSKLMACLCIVYGISAPDATILAIMRKVCYDTSFNMNSEIMMFMYRNQSCTISDIVAGIDSTAPTVTKVMNDLMALGIAQRIAKHQPKMGRPAVSYGLVTDIQESYRIIETNQES